MTQSTVYQLLESSKIEEVSSRRSRIVDSFWWRHLFFLGIAVIGYGAATILTLLV